MVQIRKKIQTDARHKLVKEKVKDDNDTERVNPAKRPRIELRRTSSPDSESNRPRKRVSTFSFKFESYTMLSFCIPCECHYLRTFFQETLSTALTLKTLIRPVVLEIFRFRILYFSGYSKPECILISELSEYVKILYLKNAKKKSKETIKMKCFKCNTTFPELLNFKIFMVFAIFTVLMTNYNLVSCVFVSIVTKVTYTVYEASLEKKAEA